MLPSVMFALLALLGLGDSVEQVLARPDLQGARVALSVCDATTGERLFSREIDTPLMPASNMKLLTTATAIDQLGYDYHFKTRLLSEGRPDDRGVVKGDLVLVGGGDPCLRADALPDQLPGDPAAFLVDLLAKHGVHRIDGALVLDDGFLDREWLSPDWEAGDLDYAFAAPVGALSIHGNCLSLELDGRGGGHTPRARIVTVADGYSLLNELKWSGGKSEYTVGALRPDDGGVVRVRGRVSRGVSESPLVVPVRDASLFFGRCLAAHLERQGITVRDGLQREAGAARTLTEAYELVIYETPLGLATILANKESDNSISDHLLKVMGAEVLEMGSFAGGRQVVQGFLRESVGTRTDGVQISDGSGLARSNKVTARAMVDTLVHMNNSAPEARALFLRTLPVSGLDGTLRDRLVEPPYLGAVRAKTGYISRVSALSGYVTTSTHRILAFSILINDIPPKSSNRVMKAIQDDICRALVDRW